MRHWPILASLPFVVACFGASRELSPITLDSMPTLGATSGAGALATWPRISPRHPLGYRVLVPQGGSGNEVPMVYADDGSFIGPLGSHGDGPGAFLEPLFSRVGPGDSLWVFDGAGRASVFSPERVFAREITLPVAPWDAAILADGRLLVASAASGAPLPLLLLSADGTTIREIGESPPGELLGNMRRIVVGPDQTIWTIAMLGSWRIEHWDTTGAALGVLAREPAWFPPYDRYQAPAPGTPPQPTLQAAWFDDAGQLWVLGKAVDEAWEDGVGALDAGGGEPGESVITDPDRVYDTVLEMVDPATGEVLAMTRLDDAWPFVAEPGALMRVRTTADGWHRAVMARVRLEEQAP